MFQKLHQTQFLGKLGFFFFFFNLNLGAKCYGAERINGDC